jgi:hypothetical protein
VVRWCDGAPARCWMLERCDGVMGIGGAAADTSSTLENFGLIEGAGVAVLGGDGKEEAINHGRIVGDVNLGGGDDKFVFAKGGVLTGDLDLGEGNDLVVIENGSSTTHIAGFAAGTESNDVIDVSAFFSNFEELTDHVVSPRTLTGLATTPRPAIGPAQLLQPLPSGLPSRIAGRSGS